ncbi:hypothetical protein GIV71_07640 [Pseudomonas syringae]|nr:hypothetical protein [Pseudomonas syringae]
MALTQEQRDERMALKRQKAREEELRLRVRPGCSPDDLAGRIRRKAAG